MIGKILVVTRSCENIFCVYFLSDFVLNQTSDMLNSFWSFFPLIMRRVVSGYNDHVNLMDVFFNIIKSLVQKLYRSITLDASVRFCLDWLSLREAIFDVAADWEVAYSGGFFSVVEIEVNVGQMQDFEIIGFGFVKDNFFVSGLPVLVEARKIFELIIDVFKVKSFVELRSTEALANPTFFENTRDSWSYGQGCQFLGNVLTEFFRSI